MSKALLVCTDLILTFYDINPIGSQDSKCLSRSYIIKRQDGLVIFYGFIRR